MDIDQDLFTKKCYKCEESVLDNLNIVYNSTNSKLFLWNKYQIFVYQSPEFECLEKMLNPEFEIQIPIVTNNYLLCLDCTGNVHITNLKFKISTQKTLKIPFRPRDQNIKICIRYKEDHVLSLKYEADTYFLCLHKMNADLQLEKMFVLLLNDEHWPLEQQSQEKYLLTICSLNKDNFDYLSKIFKTEEKFQTDHQLLVFTVDKRNIYGCLFSPKQSSDEINLIKLYSCAADICNFKIVESEELYILVGLTMGTIVKLSLNNVSKTPEIVHLNTSLYKVLVTKDDLIYTDGSTLWKAENTFSNTKFTQLFVTNVNDIIKCGDQIICTTFSKLIYNFSIDDQSAYLIPKSDEYFPANKLFHDSAYLNELFTETDRNKDRAKKLNTEQHYIIAISLSKRQDIVNEALRSSVTVFESYKEANTKCTLTEDIKEYMADDVWIFSVSIINVCKHEAINNILSQLFHIMKIYITFSTTRKILKTTCIKLTEPLKTVNYLIPLNMGNETEINVNIQVVLNIPGVGKKKALSTFYRHNVTLTSEHFVKTKEKTVHSLKTDDTFEELIHKVNEAQYGSIFSFTDPNTELKTESSFYVKLPNDYQQRFKADKQYLTQKTTFIMQQFTAEEFLNSKSQVIFSIGNELLKVQIHNDRISSPQLKVTSGNAKIAFDIRNFLANMI